MGSCESGTPIQARANLNPWIQTIKKQEEMLFVRGELQQSCNVLSGLLIPV